MDWTEIQIAADQTKKEKDPDKKEGKQRDSPLTRKKGKKRK
jgi:hypothetical protein